MRCSFTCGCAELALAQHLKTDDHGVAAGSGGRSHFNNTLKSSSGNSAPELDGVRCFQSQANALLDDSMAAIARLLVDSAVLRSVLRAATDDNLRQLAGGGGLAYAQQAGLLREVQGAAHLPMSASRGGGGAAAGRGLPSCSVPRAPERLGGSAPDWLGFGGQ